MVLYDKPELVAELGPKTKLHLKDAKGFSALHYACLKGNLPMVIALLNAGANVSEKVSYSSAHL
jgi:ankyrin repeat protein